MIRVPTRPTLPVSTPRSSGDHLVSGTAQSVNTTWKQTTPSVPRNGAMDMVRGEQRIRPVENEQSVIVPIEEADPSLHVEYELLPRKPGLKKANRKGKNAETGHSSLYRGV